ncbi:MAG: DUF1801 domain-containing protein [Blastocatellia bacterium]|nr:MAG: DUF1801 domain-containing protein [Blastocatellia bacterium]
MDSVAAFISKIPDEARQRDCLAVAKMMEEITGHEPKMWGSSIVGFDSYHYKYASGREGDSPVVAFSPRKGSLTLYLMGVFDNHEELMKKLGKYTNAKGCLYIKSLSDVHAPTLKKLIRESVKYVKKTYP